MQEFIRIISEFDGINPKWINIIGFVFIGLVGLINIGIGWYGNSKIEKYKHELSIISKKMEIKNREHFESQIKALKFLFEKYINVEYSTKMLIKDVFLYDPQNSPQDELMLRINNWNYRMKDIHIFYNRNKIVFSNEIEKVFSNQLNEFLNLYNYLKSEQNELIRYYKLNPGVPEDSSGNDVSIDNEDSYETEVINKIKSNVQFINICNSFEYSKALLKREYKHLIN